MTDISRKRGDTYADEFTINSAVTGRSLDITGYTFVMTLDPEKSPASAANNVYQLPGVIVGAGAAGRVEFAPTALQADHVGLFYYDVQMIDGAGRKRTIEGGKYKYSQDITK